MFCRNCGFETEDSSITKCPECSCILSPGTSDSTGDEEAEEIFDDIDNILGSDDLEIDKAPEKIEALEQGPPRGGSPETELETINTDTDSKETPDDEKAFDLDFESGEQNETEISEGAEVQTDKIPEGTIIDEPGPAVDEDREDPPEQDEEENEGPAVVLETADDLPEEEAAEELKTDEITEPDNEDGETEDKEAAGNQGYANEDQEEEDKKTEPIEEQPSEEDSDITDESSDTDNEPEEEDQEDTEDDEETEKTGPEKSSAVAPLLLVLFLLIIAAGAGVFYLKTKQPPAPPVQKIKTPVKKDKILKSILKKEEKKLQETNKPVKKQPEAKIAPVKAQPPEPEKQLKTGILPPEEKPEIINPAKNSGEPVQKELSAAEKKKPVEEKKQTGQKPLKDKKASLSNHFWTKYIPGKQTYYTLQISSMATRAYAESNLTRLKKKGYPAYVILTKDRKGQPIYKLRVGKYKTEAEAKKEASILHKNENLNHIIVHSNAEIDL